MPDSPGPSALNLNWKQIDAEILNTEFPDRPVADFDYEDARELVHILSDRFLLDDLRTHSFYFVERPFSTAISRGIADLGGAEVVVDWKVRMSGELDPAWQQRQVDSWQWRITSAALGCRKFIYRGISRQTGKVREVVISVPDGNSERVQDFLQGLTAARTAMLAFPVFPQNKPAACHSYNRTCEFYQDCVRGTEPRSTLPLLKPLSYTAAMRLLECPEKYRRHLLQDSALETDETEFGKMVHRGIAEVYRQALGLARPEPNAI